MNLLKIYNSRFFHQVFINLDAAFVIHFGIGHPGPVKFGLQHYSLHHSLSIMQLSISLALPICTARAIRVFSPISFFSTNVCGSQMEM